MNPPQPRLIDNGNGHPLASHWYRPAGEPRGYLLIVPAMGVEQRFYAPFAAWLAERGYLAITFDYLGMGQSRNGSLRGLEVDVLGWARHDCSAMLAAALAESGSKPLYWIGHSLGGQILPFVEGRERIERVFSIAPQFVELRPGYAEVTFPKRREVLNHIGTVHAIALCNAAELASGTMTDASIPAGHRWIPRGMTVEYLAKATGDVRAVADGSQIDWQATGNLVVPVVAY
ncbi:alpha/beta fold hydrolase, partial [Pseudomonas aeruginosa]|nr:alpha/beta fold hydrolase [Pseudomonas aeruginosa]